MSTIPESSWEWLTTKENDMSNIKNISINGKVTIDDKDSYQTVLQHSKKATSL